MAGTATSGMELSVLELAEQAVATNRAIASVPIRFIPWTVSQGSVLMPRSQRPGLVSSSKRSFSSARVHPNDRQPIVRLLSHFGTSAVDGEQRCGCG